MKTIPKTENLGPRITVRSRLNRIVEGIKQLARNSETVDQSEEIDLSGIHVEYLESNALNEAVIYRRWDECRNLIRSEDLLRLVHFQDEDGHGPLHMACWRNAPVDLVRSICVADPRHVVWGDRFGRTPLYNACCWGASEQLVALLLTYAPRATGLAYCGNLPIHEAVQVRRSPSLIRRLLIVHPTSAYARNRFGKSPLNVFLTKWQKTLSGVYPHYERLPSSHYLDGNIDGLTLMIKIFLLLIMAYSHGTVDKTKLKRKWLPLHEALKIKEVDVTDRKSVV